MKPVTNIVLYAFAPLPAGVSDEVRVASRKPLASFAPNDKWTAPKIAAKIGDEMRLAERAGVTCPDFKIVSETRTADEGGRFVFHAEFVELDSSLSPIGDKFNSLADLFANRDPVPVVVETAEQKTEREAATKSAALSV